MPDTSQGSLLKCPPGRGEKGSNDFICVFRSLIFRHISIGHYYAHQPNEATDCSGGLYPGPPAKWLPLIRLLGKDLSLPTPQLQELKALASASSL